MTDRLTLTRAFEGAGIGPVRQPSGDARKRPRDLALVARPSRGGMQHVSDDQPRDLIRALERDGWHRVRVTGDHYHFRHPTKPGLVTVPHPRRDVPTGTLRSIERQRGLRLR